MLNVTALTQHDAETCPVRQILSQVTGKWQILILLSLEDGAMRFGALKRNIGDITQRVLTENLRKMERDGYLTRDVDPGPPVAVSYELTDMGEELLEQMKSLVFWAARRHTDVTASRTSFDAR